MGSTALRERARIFLATNAPAREAKLAVRTLSGKLARLRGRLGVGQGATVHGEGVYARVRRIALVSSTLVAGAALVSSAATGGVAAPGAVRTVDRTLACTTGVQGGAVVIFLRGQSAFGEGKNLEWLASDHGSRSRPAGVRRSRTTGRRSPGCPPAGRATPPVDVGWTSGSTIDACKATRSKVAFVRSGLVGGVAASSVTSSRASFPSRCSSASAPCFGTRRSWNATLLLLRERPRAAWPDSP